jgi:hypothetical protein
VSPHKPEDFLVWFDYPEQRDVALRVSSIRIGAATFAVHPWCLDTSSRSASWFFQVKIYIEGIRQVLGDICVFNRMEAESYRQDNAEAFCFFAWMANPDLLPRQKTVTFLSEWAGRSSSSYGPPPAEAPLPSPPSGADIALLIHLDHYFDWTP